jgi:hypothetical protein
MASSANLLTWTAHESAPATQAYWSCIAYGGGKFVAVASNANPDASDIGFAMESSNGGITWQPTPASIDHREWNSIASDGGATFLVVSNDGHSSIYDNAAPFVAWTTPEPLPYFPTLEPGQRVSVTYGNNRFVVVRAGFAATYAEGVWTRSEWPPATAVPWVAVTYAGNNTFVAVSTDGNITRSADNGVTWANAMPSPGSFFVDVASDGNGIVIAVAAFSPSFKSINFGESWLGIDNLGDANSITFGGGDVGMPLFVVARKEDRPAVSRNAGQTWTDEEVPSSNNAWRNIAAGPGGVFVAVSQHGTGRVRRGVINSATEPPAGGGAAAATQVPGGRGGLRGTLSSTETAVIAVALGASIFAVLGVIALSP